MRTNTKLRKLLHAAKELPDGERTELALRILDTIEAPDPLAHLDDKAWVAEIERRAENAISGKTRGTPWSRVKASLERKLKQRKKR